MPFGHAASLAAHTYAVINNQVRIASNLPNLLDALLNYKEIKIDKLDVIFIKKAYYVRNAIVHSGGYSFNKMKQDKMKRDGNSSRWEKILECEKILSSSRDSRKKLLKMNYHHSSESSNQPYLQIFGFYFYSSEISRISNSPVMKQKYDAWARYLPQEKDLFELAKAAEKIMTSVDIILLSNEILDYAGVTGSREWCEINDDVSDYSDGVYDDMNSLLESYSKYKKILKRIT